MRRVFLSLIAVAAMLTGFAPSAWASEPSVTVDWNQTAPLSGRVVDGAVEVTSSGTGGTFPLVAIADPVTSVSGYALTGRVRYRGVAGVGFLEMWSVFPNGGRYFSRTLAGDGPQARISGDSEWRDFELPFYLNGSERPVRLELGLVLAGAGRVWIGPLELTAPGATTSAWWSDRTGGLIGGIAGSLIGITGAIVGVLIVRGRGRRAVLTTMAALAIAGSALFVAGAAALALSQPYAVYFPLLLGGIILVAVFGPGFRRARRAYEDVELRRMRAMDTAPS
jgi:hypothetical protein